MPSDGSKDSFNFHDDNKTPHHLQAPNQYPYPPEQDERQEEPDDDGSDDPLSDTV
ncbi:hypothetical protein [Streptomyces sp. NRRL B-1140]|uniref:hypothetical protein n=1 Tax=Streptomyces sp. NRRL B-1140 TaxID=1415549 RepID=UPI000AAAB0B3|nr:hypothetical protein [Streptomyces sp. NRRL B-1140]